jgi:hypothetical protein
LLVHQVLLLLLLLLLLLHPEILGRGSHVSRCLWW